MNEKIKHIRMIVSSNHKSLIRPLKGLIRPLKGLIRPLKGLIRLPTLANTTRPPRGLQGDPPEGPQAVYWIDREPR